MTLLGITVIAFTAGTVAYLIYKSSPDDNKKDEKDKE
jgi:hypothetical protein